MRFIIGFIVAIGLLIVAFVIIFSGHGNTNETPANAPTKLLDYANTSKQVVLTTEGPVNANQNHKEVRITVGNTATTIDIFQGYEQTLLSTQSYANNTASYSDFLKSLDLAGYTKGDTNPKIADERGYCATGSRYVMTIKDGDHDTQRYWSSSCGLGSFKGKTQLVRSLFQAQVPNYDSVAGNAFYTY